MAVRRQLRAHAGPFPRNHHVPQHGSHAGPAHAQARLLPARGRPRRRGHALERHEFPLLALRLSDQDADGRTVRQEQTRAGLPVAGLSAFLRGDGALLHRLRNGHRRLRRTRTLRRQTLQTLPHAAADQDPRARPVRDGGQEDGLPSLYDPGGHRLRVLHHAGRHGAQSLHVLRVL